MPDPSLGAINMNEFDVSIVTPDGSVVTEKFEMVSARTAAGDIGVMAGHIPLVAPLTIGAVRLKKANKTEWLAVSGGFLEVRHDQVTILAQSAERAETIDLARAQEAKKRAEHRLSTKVESMDDARADLALQRAINRMNVASHR